MDVLREVVAYYGSQYDEETRLSDVQGQLELLRTQSILARYLPPGALQIVDVGGGHGVHARWLASQGHEVTLVDAVPRHVQRALELSEAVGEDRLKACLVGDARALPLADASADVVLLLGPLYHLPEQSDRLLAMREASRLLRPDGLCFMAAISRFASMLDGYFLPDGSIEDPDYLTIVRQDLADGQHRNPTEKPYFTTAYFHEPDALDREVGQSGLQHMATLAVEGPFWMLQDLSRHLGDAGLRAQLLDMLSQVEAERGLLGCSAHCIAVARKRGATV